MEELKDPPNAGGGTGVDPEAARAELLDGLADLRRAIEAAEEVVDDLTDQVTRGAGARQQEIAHTLGGAEEELAPLAPALATASDLADEERFVAQARAALERELPQAERAHDPPAAMGERTATGGMGGAVSEGEMPSPVEGRPRRAPRRIAIGLFLLVVVAALGAVILLGSPFESLPTWLRPLLEQLPTWLQPMAPDPAP